MNISDRPVFQQLALLLLSTLCCGLRLAHQPLLSYLLPDSRPFELPLRQDVNI